MNNSINKLSWIALGVIFGIVVTGTVFLYFSPVPPLTYLSSFAQNPANKEVEHAVSRPVSVDAKVDSTGQPAASETATDGGVAVSRAGVAHSAKSAETAQASVSSENPDPAGDLSLRSSSDAASADTRLNLTKEPAARSQRSDEPGKEGDFNPEYKRLLAEARQLLDVVVKLDFTTSALPEYKSLLKQLGDSAGTANELKTVLELEKEFDKAVGQIEEKRETWFLSQLGGIRLALEELQAAAVVSPESLTERLGKLLDECSKLGLHAPSAHGTQCAALADDIRTLLKTLTLNQKVYAELSSLDKVENDRMFEETLRRIATRHADSPCVKDIVVVLESLPVLNAIPQWNEFVEADGMAFDRFAVPAAKIAAGNAFFHGHARDLDFLPEWKVLQKRLKQLQLSAKDLPVNEKITMLLRHAGSRRFWIYKKTPVQWYYLTQKPVTGNNLYLADLYGTEKNVVIPNDAVSMIEEALWVPFFKDLGEKAESIEDSLKFQDAGQWYARWCQTIEAIRARSDLDPLVQFLFLKDICSTLAEADAHFAKRLAPWLRVFNSTDFATGVDWYDAEGGKTSQLRVTAAQLLRFLQSDELSFSKTTQELNDTIEPLSFVYSRLGWLDRAPGGSWHCRLFSCLPSPKDGELFVLQYNPENQNRRWIRIGHVEGGKVNVELISNELRVGAPVFVRSRFTSR